MTSPARASDDPSNEDQIDQALERRDFSTASRLLAPLVEAGDRRALRILGLMRLHGEGVDQDPVEAAKLLRLSADKGDKWSQFYYGKMNMNGVGIEKNEYEAIRYLGRAAAQGHSEASFELGKLYGQGYYSGDVAKITILGREAERPTNSVQKNAVEAARWYRQAANAGSAGAQYNLGNIFAEGIGVPRNYVEAANLFRLAARQGQSMAQTNLGALYSNGWGVRRSYYKGYLWSVIAAASGESQAITNRDVAAAQLSGSERSAAELLAAKCVETKFQQEGCD